MASARDVLTPDALALLQAIAQAGSFAAAARTLGVVPSALSYRVRQMEDALDVLLYDRSSRQARLTEAGLELLREGARLLEEIDAVANRVKRVATGWEPQLSIAIDSIISKATVMELCATFFALNPPTRIKLRDETLSGTLDALMSGQADLALGVSEASTQAGIHSKPLGEVSFVYAMAPHHPLTQAPEPLKDELVRQHRAVAVADTISRGGGMTIGLLGGQDVFTVATMQDKLDAQLRGLGSGFVPQCMARAFIETGRLVVKKMERPQALIRVNYAWRRGAKSTPGRALQWWLEQLESPTTRMALLERHRGV
ncbi:MAG: LysR family transcriptional regulator [Gammaproteobacteria bacterium]|uniref:LysR family transcriptional regulator n=1 Tax=Rhodoferax sp. TaxID=50421 RepID=UPI001849964F|nr:LysR family transcriptional regulator [Rhodoferax sp.]MBU3898955.1 LysR family transcriptional regulator [Gammaproteobacteria bacterium]MBA3059302.1 LysR family transcriptional regulator [Rhodoferax sp.]MBU3997496.1 LysR family transcriptional regulator [Gammaproteobacteria bacterium]MBU4018398.1 LysR family transcriptional regulator [Gammaproteobacteria bacterium]MBU4080410.1 LysR family transcriptional regulator [Gammaproteobacteria bacterium]